MAEEIGADFAFLEVGQEDAIDATSEQPGHVCLAHAQRQLPNVLRSATTMSKA